MTITQFIEKSGAVMGGTHATIYELFLDPAAWKAVGKVEGWEGKQRLTRFGKPDRRIVPITFWRGNMHGMIDALADGKSMEQFLETL